MTTKLITKRNFLFTDSARVGFFQTSVQDTVKWLMIKGLSREDAIKEIEHKLQRELPLEVRGGL